jgi:DNA-binding PadR family transcriptional regulator
VYPEDESTASQWIKETQKGYLRIAVLILLSRKPHYGYEIMKEIRERTMGFWRPTAGGIYPVLKDLEKSGYIEGEWKLQKKRKRKIYGITKAGKSVLEKALAKNSQIASRMGGIFKDLRTFMKDVLDIKMSSKAMPRMPNVFMTFLEERREKPEDSINSLERKRAQIKNIIKELQKEVGAIDKRLVQMKQRRGPAARSAAKCGGA